MIPKIIYTVWISDKPFPDKFRHFIDGWKELMPDYEIIEITLDNCPHNKWVDEALNNKKYILAGHYARCQKLYETGGIYFDIDIEAIKRFDDLLDNDFFIGVERKDVVNNAAFGSCKGNPILQQCMTYMENMPINSPNIELETGPRMFSNIIKGMGWDGNNINTKINNIQIYNNKYFYPYSYLEKYYPACRTEDTHAIHHWGYTWGTGSNLMSTDLVSVIIPCYNQAQYLSEAIESVLNQTYNNIEVIVVDDGSPDNTEQVARKYPVKYIKKENGGVSSARNAGIKASNGKWILTLDADDIIDKDYIKKAVGLNDIVSSNLKTFGLENGVWDSPNTYPTFEQELWQNQIHCCSLFKKEIWEKVGGYDENMKNGYEDWDFYTRAMYYGYKTTVIREPLFFYRKHGKSMIDDARKNHGLNREYMLNKYRTFNMID